MSKDAVDTRRDQLVSIWDATVTLMAKGTQQVLDAKSPNIRDIERVVKMNQSFLKDNECVLVNNTQKRIDLQQVLDDAEQKRTALLNGTESVDNFEDVLVEIDEED